MWRAPAIHLTTIIIGVICSFLLFALNMRGLAAAAGVQKILCFILVGSAVVGAVASLLHGSPEHWQPLYDTSNPMIYGDPSQGYVEATNSSMFGGILAIMSSAPFFLAGFETIPQGVEEAGGDIKSVGKTVVLSGYPGLRVLCVPAVLLRLCLGLAGVLHNPLRSAAS